MLRTPILFANSRQIVRSWMPCWAIQILRVPIPAIGRIAVTQSQSLRQSKIDSCSRGRPTAATPGFFTQPRYRLRLQQLFELVALWAWLRLRYSVWHVFNCSEIPVVLEF